jgi:hypothetical protein
MFDGAETIHPNGAGHASIAGFLEDFLEEAWNAAGAGASAQTAAPSGASAAVSSAAVSSAAALPAPLYGDDFQDARLYGSSELEAIEGSGWSEGSEVHGEWRSLGGAKAGWTARDEEARIAFRLRGTSVGVTYAESDRYRNAEAWVEYPDGSASRKVSLDCFVSYRNGYLGWAYREIARWSEPRDFILRIQVKKGRAAEKGRSANVAGIVLTGAGD